MRKGAILLFLILIIFGAAFAETAPEEALIIPQTDNVYADFYSLASQGLIKSVPAENFKMVPISTYDAARYVVEAASNLYSLNTAANAQTQASQVAMLRKYFQIYRTKAFEIYGKTIEMRNKLKQIEAILSGQDTKDFKKFIDDATDTMSDISMEYAKTTYRGIPPFKVQGMLTGRWQNVEAFGPTTALINGTPARINQTSLGGTFMSLWTEGDVTPDINFKLNLNFEMPRDEADKNMWAEYWGTGTRFLDTYTINLGIYGWTVATGFFWEDITPFVAKSILSERPAYFERDPYAVEETSEGHYENAFLHSFIKRGDIWSKHGFMGVGIYNTNLFGTNGQLKMMASKAEKFDEFYDRYFLYEYAARYVQPFEIGPLYDSKMSINLFTTSNELSEIETLAQLGGNYPEYPFGYIKSDTIAGFNFDSNIFNLVQVSTEFEQSNYHGYILTKPFQNSTYADSSYPPRVNETGTAFFLLGKIRELANLEAKYTAIDPNYIAEASSVIDTAERTAIGYKNVGPNQYEVVSPNDNRTAKVTWDTYGGDPTLIYNNVSRFDLHSSVVLPNGFLNLSYGTAGQINPTTNRMFVDHFAFGNRLSGPMWWHLFYSQYGNPVPGRDNGYSIYNSPDQSIVDSIPGYSGQGKRYLYTDLWLTNKEEIFVDQSDPTALSRKYFNNASAELKFQLNKMLGIENNLFVQFYGELVSVWSGADLGVTYGDPNALFTSNLLSTFVYYNITKKSGIMFEGTIERWSSDRSVARTDVNQLLQSGVDASGNPVYSLYNTPSSPDYYRPIDYFDHSLALGFDYDFAPRTSLYLRVKQFWHTDAKYPTQNFNGTYLLAEVKNFF